MSFRVFKASLQDNMTIHITTAAMHNRNCYFIVRGHLDRSTPFEQARVDPCITIRRGSYRLGEASLWLFNHLLTERVEA
jgi:hypothetical protein